MSDNIKQSNTQKLKPIPIIILAAVAVVLIIGIVVYAMTRPSKNLDNQVQVNLNQTNLKNDNTESVTSSAATTIEIIMEDSAIPVGTSLQVTAIVSPEDTEHALNWTSSNKDVFSVDSDGRITITGTGTAALTATIGTVSDAVAIEGIASVTSGSVNGYPVNTSGNTASNGNSGENISGGNTSGGSTTGGSNIGDTGNSSGGGSNAGGSGSGNGSGSDSGSNGNDSGDGSGNSSTGGSDNGSSGDSNGSSSNDIVTVLPDNGFTQIMSNVYVCEENGIYYGQIVTQPNVTIVYIKERSTAFDSKVQNVIAKLLPEEHGQVWNNYLSANTDRTFTAEGRKVRIVVASGGGHSQIVIYN